MTPERKEQIRKVCVEWDMPSAKAVQELLAEVDRLEAVNALLAQRLGSASLALHYGDHHGPYARCMAESCRLDREVCHPLDSPPAKR